MPPLQGFTDNAFATRNDFETVALALLRPLRSHQSTGGARIRIPVATGTHFDETAAQLEGFARPLWAVASLICGRDHGSTKHDELFAPYIRGLVNGTDPAHAEYWGSFEGIDQRMVEMEIISFALLAAPDQFFHSQTDNARQKIIAWLSLINGKEMPPTNWRWFRVMTNLALVKVAGTTYEELQPLMKADLDLLEIFYVGEGWAADGEWSDSGRQADYYSGSFAIQFSQLLYVKYANDIDPERCERFRQRACEFATTFLPYFNANGGAIPFGRSLTYRFAMVGFFSAAALAEVELPAPLNDPGVVKGLVLRHLRWWAKKPDIFNSDGTFTIGFTYPQMYLSEDYNSPQSPYWALKTLCPLGLPEEHAFWTSTEKAFPRDHLPPLSFVKPAMHIVSNNSNHHFLLSSGQFCPWPLKATEAKYGKFAYSSHFGFSVPTGPLIQQVAPDSTLALSNDDGDTWKVCWKPSTSYFGRVRLYRGSGDPGNFQSHDLFGVLTSCWKPWRNLNIQVRTTLIPPTQTWPNWHVRIHEISMTSNEYLPRFEAVEGAFAVHGRKASDGLPLPSFKDIPSLLANAEEAQYLEGTVNEGNRAIVFSDAGATGIRNLQSAEDGARSTSDILKPDANTNLMHQRTLIPTLRSHFSHISKSEITLAVGVFAVARGVDGIADLDKSEILRQWGTPPIVNLSLESGFLREGIFIDANTFFGEQP